MATIRRRVFLRSLWPFVSDLYGKERRELNPHQRCVNLTKIFNLLIKHYFNGLRFAPNQHVFVLRNKMKFEDVASLYDQTHLLSKRDAKRFMDSNKLEYIFNTGQVSLRRGNEFKLKKFVNLFLNKIFERWKGQIDENLKKTPQYIICPLNYSRENIQILERRITRLFKRINGSGIRINKNGQVSIKEPMYVRLYVIDGIPEEFTFQEFCEFQSFDYNTFNSESYRRKFLKKFFPNFIKIS
jgi:hypothetical protein